MEGFLGRVVINAVALFIISYLNFGLKMQSIGTTLIAALVLGLLNAIVRPILGFLSLPITILTLGLFSLVLNAFMFWLVAKLVPGVQASNWVLAWLAYSVIVWIISAIVRWPRSNGRSSMKSFRKELWFNVPGRRGFINITPQVEAAVRESGVREGMVLVNAMHITASVFINDDESGLHHDYDVWLEKLASHEPVSGYWHNRTGEDNADAHMKRQVMGREVVVALTEGRLDFGPWEQIFYGEFDGGRRKRVLVKIIGE